MRALAREQWPRPTDPRAVEWRAICMLAVTVVVVPIPAGAMRKLDLEPRINHFDRVQNPGVIGGPQSESHQRQRVGADNLRRLLQTFSGRPVFDGNESLGRRSSAVRFGRRNSHIVTFDPDLPGEVTVARIRPALNVVIPRIGELA